MDYNLSIIAKSLATYLGSFFEDVTFYENPNQQGTQLPAMFLQTRSGSIQSALSDYSRRTFKLDLVYLEDYNLTNLQEIYQEAAEILDQVMRNFPIFDEDENLVEIVRTENRSWKIEYDALHYNFDLVTRVVQPETGVKMQTYTEEMEVTN